MLGSCFLRKTALSVRAPVDTSGGFCSDAPVKFLLPLVLFVAFAFSACNTIENRRNFYTNQKVHGPYTRELEEGNWGNPQTVDQQYETRREARRPKLIQPKAAPSTSGSSTSAPSAGADAVAPRY